MRQMSANESAGMALRAETGTGGPLSKNLLTRRSLSPLSLKLRRNNRFFPPIILV